MHTYTLSLALSLSLFVSLLSLHLAFFHCLSISHSPSSVPLPLCSLLSSFYLTPSLSPHSLQPLRNAMQQERLPGDTSPVGSGGGAGVGHKRSRERASDLHSGRIVAPVLSARCVCECESGGCDYLRVDMGM